MSKTIVTCTGYGGTGSSAITDLLKEFDNGLSLGSAEFWFLQGYDGVSDLEYYLVDGNHRSKVNLAIKRFQKYVDNHNKFYSTFFGDKYKEYSDDYIETLIDVKFKKSISYYEINNKLKRSFFFRVSPFVQRVVVRILRGRVKEFSPYIPMDDKTYSTPDRRRFYEATKNYTKNLFDTIGSNHSFIAIDQLVPAMNAKRYLNYVHNLKIIVVDRDPRDLFLLNELYWKGAAYVCDTESVDEYISWYRSIRAHRKFESKNENILHIMLEDLIFNTNETLGGIYTFLGVDKSNHTKKGHFFKPSVSERHTRLWEKFPEYRRLDVDKIQKELHEYCFQM